MRTVYNGDAAATAVDHRMTDLYNLAVHFTTDVSNLREWVVTTRLYPAHIEPYPDFPEGPLPSDRFEREQVMRKHEDGRDASKRSRTLYRVSDFREWAALPTATDTDTRVAAQDAARRRIHGVDGRSRSAWDNIVKEWQENDR